MELVGDVRRRWGHGSYRCYLSRPSPQINADNEGATQQGGILFGLRLRLKIVEILDRKREEVFREVDRINQNSRVQERGQQLFNDRGGRLRVGLRKHRRDLQ